MDNQERNREALIDHIDELQRIILRRNQQIENQARNAEEDQRAIDEQDARINSLDADLAAAVNRAGRAERELEQSRRVYGALTDKLATTARKWDKAEQERDEYRAMHSEQMKTITRLQENPRPLTADDVDRALDAAVTSWRTSYPPEDQPYETWKIKQATWSALLVLGLIASEPPSRPEGAEELEALIDRASLDGEDADNESLADYLAARLIDPTVKEQS